MPCRAHGYEKELKRFNGIGGIADFKGSFSRNDKQEMADGMERFYMCQIGARPVLVASDGGK
ncbi:hypothetical protein GCM10020370_63910 [Paenibacillus hodogayensis]